MNRHGRFPPLCAYLLPPLVTPRRLNLQYPDKRVILNQHITTFKEMNVQFWHDLKKKKIDLSQWQPTKLEKKTLAVMLGYPLIL